MRLLLYPHGGSGNHGCEAIVRGTASITDAELTLFSSNPDEDRHYGLDEVCSIKPFMAPIKKNLQYVVAAAKYRFSHNPDIFDRLAFSELFKEGGKCDIALSIGGDNYCYGVPQNIMFINRELRKRNIRNVLWGCSITPDTIQGDVLRDLQGYDLIIARESITYNALKDSGVNQVELYPDPAFIMQPKEVELPDGWQENKMVGINASPMILDYSSDGNTTMRNYEQLIGHILENTDMSVALIPHVVWSHNDDRKPLEALFDKYKATGRVILLDKEYDATELKYIISRLRFLITARTHASIAGYSTCVPTIVMGYSVKAKGIAKDIFGQWEEYIVPVQGLENESTLTERFKWFVDNELNIRQYLEGFMPEYKQRAYAMADSLKRL